MLELILMFQVNFWQRNVYPLLVEQDALREKLIASEKRALGDRQ
jgi:hypothetical protein